MKNKQCKGVLRQNPFVKTAAQAPRIPSFLPSFLPDFNLFGAPALLQKGNPKQAS